MFSIFCANHHVSFYIIYDKNKKKNVNENYLELNA